MATETMRNGFIVVQRTFTHCTIDVGDCLEYNTPDWLFCDDSREEGVEEDEDGGFHLPVIDCWLESMARKGCSEMFMRAYRTALELGADIVTLY